MAHLIFINRRLALNFWRPTGENTYLLGGLIDRGFEAACGAEASV
jgi:hypothetical protein